jgi:hypothetical protein
MDRADEVIYFVGLPGVPRVILWVKFRLQGGEVHFLWVKISHIAIKKGTFYTINFRHIAHNNLIRRMKHCGEPTVLYNQRYAPLSPSYFGAAAHNHATPTSCL